MSSSGKTFENKEHPKTYLGIKFLIYPQFQLILIVVNTLITLGIFGIVYLQIYRTFGHFKQTGNQLHLPVDHAFYQLIDIQSARIYFAVMIATGIGIFLSSAFMLVLSYRLASPIVRMSNYFSSLAKNGTFKKLEVKKGDFFGHIPKEINGALEVLARK